jgi:tripartite ATP-independent transporter DctM subunit
VIRRLRAAEEGVAATVLLVTALLPLLEMAGRRLWGIGVPGSGPFVQHATLWVGFLGAALAARDGRLLSLATASFLPAGTARRIAQVVAGGTAAAVATLLALAATTLIEITREADTVVAVGVRAWVLQLVLPVGFAAIAARSVWRAGGATERALASLGLALGAAAWWAAPALEGAPGWLGFAILLPCAALGAPLFALIGGLAAWLFLADGVTPATILVETYALSVSPTLPAIPLFTLAGIALAEGRSSERLLAVFRACFGWLPGGSAVVCAMVCTLFTTLTGGSGVTIVALGGLLLPALLRDGYRERFSLGLLTASGSLGILLPPALPLIVYAVVAEIPIEDLFVGGLLPGTLMTVLVAAYGVRQGIVSGVARRPLRVGEARRALWRAKWELALPALVLFSLLGGLATAVEAAALAAAYALSVQLFVHRELAFGRDLVRVGVECVTLIGSILLILSVAVGLTGYLVNAEIPAALLDWTREHVASRAAFLLALNGFLLVVGCLMDVFSATVVVVPLIVPLAAHYGVDPVHLGILFLANLELGYLTPPVGLNLFLAAQRFEKPVLTVTRAALPLFGVLALGVLLITYVPALTTGLLSLMGER